MTLEISMLEEVEARRCAALMAGDAGALEAMLAADLVHIHLDGRVDDKTGYMAGFREQYLFRDVVRGALNIRTWGDSAVMVGPLTQRLTLRKSGEEIAVRAITTQTWQRSGGEWLLTTCHNAPVAS
ncbi:nuclear transport factor 2 family protein [Aquabacter spiritensis]|uniref:Uncharacterized protein DUF4440 n=1 Tax=Aquabacter spiritensis TaxID=933073 RepID=A0A4R3LPU7_9HYPH|nr:nuclear transport factor 2 family protein [Aquabacter spiritensis]TCT02211.1 uncharacterized protein DUF4440 [Aquabacter spiritensis]